MHRFQPNVFSGLYGITDTQLQPGDTLFQQVEQALSGGASIIQYRDKSLDPSTRLDQASRLLQICRKYQRPLIINDDLDLATQIGADGVHLGQQDGALSTARRLLGDDAIIGITCHDTLALALRAEQDGADYVAFGAFFPSSTKPNASPAPIQLLHDARQQLGIPIVAIGGITVDNASLLIGAGAAMVAVVHSLFAAQDISLRARRFQALFPQT